MSFSKIGFHSHPPLSRFMVQARLHTHVHRPSQVQEKVAEILKIERLFVGYSCAGFQALAHQKRQEAVRLRNECDLGRMDFPLFAERFQQGMPPIESLAAFTRQEVEALFTSTLEDAETNRYGPWVAGVISERIREYRACYAKELVQEKKICT
jgi:hypothetical protein